MKTIAFFNNKGGVGKTSLVYHLAWMLADLGHSVVAMDLDPQSNLTSMFLPESELELLWPDNGHPETILGCLEPLMESLGDIEPPTPRQLQQNLHLVPGDLGLSAFEDQLAEAWARCLDTNPFNSHRAFRVMTAFYRVMLAGAARVNAEYVLIDVGPSIGALNRAALVAADVVVIPLGADLFSLQGLRNLGPALRDWRSGWIRRSTEQVPPGLPMPGGTMTPLGYVLLHPSVRQNRPVKAYRRWADRIPSTYREHVLAQPPGPSTVDADPNLLAMIRHYKSLMPMAQDARKPMFRLTAADGAIGSHAAAVEDSRRQFERLAREIVRRTAQPC